MNNFGREDFKTAEYWSCHVVFNNYTYTDL